MTSTGVLLYKLHVSVTIPSLIQVYTIIHLANNVHSILVHGIQYEYANLY